MTDINTSDGAVLEALNNKADLDMANLPANIDYVIETWKSADGLSWYRLYKSGWIEQGVTAKTPINLPKAMKNDQYTALTTDITNTLVSGNVSISSKTTTTIYLTVNDRLCHVYVTGEIGNDV